MSLKRLWFFKFMLASKVHVWFDLRDDDKIWHFSSLWFLSDRVWSKWATETSRNFLSGNIECYLIIGLLVLSFPCGSDGKIICLQRWRPGFDPLIGKIPWRRKRQPTLVFLPRAFPWTEEPGRLQSMGLQRVKHDWVINTFTFRRWSFWEG